MMALSPLPLVSMGKAVVSTVIIGVCLFIVPLAPLVLAPLLALPLAYVVARHGRGSGVVVAAVVGALLWAVVGEGPALLVFLVLITCGLVLGWALSKGWGFSRTLGWTSGSLVLASVIYGMILWLVFGVTLSGLREAAYRSIAEAGRLYADIGVSATTVDALSSQLRKLVDVLPYLVPGLLGMAALLLAACSVGLAYLIFPRLRYKSTITMSLSGFRMHWGVAYASIVGLAMLLFSRGEGAARSFLLYTGVDILLVSQTLFFLQALGVIRWLGWARQWRPGSRAAVFILAVFAQALFQLTGLVGLLDTWIDYRRRFALKSPGAGSAR
jgi:uncharacterized protein YybS (DUF2232 family)